MVGTGMAAPFPAAAAAAAAAAHQFAANGDALAGVKAEASGPAAPAQSPLVKSEGPPASAPLPPANFSPQPPQQSHATNSIENQNNNNSVSDILNLHIFHTCIKKISIITVRTINSV